MSSRKGVGSVRSSRDRGRFDGRFLCGAGAGCSIGFIVGAGVGWITTLAVMI